MRWKDYFFLFALFSYTVTCNGNSIYLDNISEDLLVESIKLAEKELRIYIYNTSDVNYHNIELKDSLKHFRTEYLFVDYLEMIFQDANHDDHRKKMIVRNPNDANVFIIDHRVFNGKFNSVDEMVLYIRAIIDHVINDLPYYKRNGGEDHYFFGVHSNGPFCMDGWREPLAKEFRRLAGANYIGNYGMDDEYERTHPLSNVPCHRVGKDIVIPQYMGQWSNMFLSHSNLYRPYDSVWAGSIWGNRTPLVRMNETVDSDYENLQTERYKASFSGRRRLSLQETRSVSLHRRLIDSDLAHRGYFGYNPCGMVCWSQRLYFELNQYTIPIIVSSGGILPFDKFLNWTTFSMKITSEIWNDYAELTLWRRKIRKECDIFRGILDEYFDYYIESRKLPSRSRYEIIKNQIVSDIAVEGKSSPSFSRLQKTYIWKKRKHIEEALPWLYIKDDIKKDHKKHGFRLLCLEIWCRLDYRKTHHICQHRSDRTSRMSYE